MREAVKSAADFLNAAAKVVLVVGSQVRLCKAHKQAVQLADACQYPVAVMPRSKGMFPETHPRWVTPTSDGPALLVFWGRGAGGGSRLS